MDIKNECLNMLNSIEQNAYGAYCIPNMIKKVDKNVIINGEEIELKYGNAIPSCIEYLKKLLMGEIE